MHDSLSTTASGVSSVITYARTRLRLGVTTYADIGPCAGPQALLIALHSSNSDYEYRRPGIKAELTFTHSRLSEHFKTAGWFASVHKGRVGDWPVIRAGFDPTDRMPTWLIVYLGKNFDGEGPHWFAGPQNDIAPLMASGYLSHDSRRLSAGGWQVKIALSCDHGDTVEHVIQIQAS